MRAVQCSRLRLWPVPNPILLTVRAADRSPSFPHLLVQTCQPHLSGQPAAVQSCRSRPDPPLLLGWVDDPFLASLCHLGQFRVLASCAANSVTLGAPAVICPVTQAPLGGCGPPWGAAHLGPLGAAAPCWLHAGSLFPAPAPCSFSHLCFVAELGFLSQAKPVPHSLPREPPRLVSHLRHLCNLAGSRAPGWVQEGHAQPPRASAGCELALAIQAEFLPRILLARHAWLWAGFSHLLGFFSIFCGIS